jgi:excisionase family DNA binding protein
MNTSDKPAILADGLLTVKEAMQLCKMGRSYLYAEMDHGRLAWVKLGRARRIPRASLLALMEKGLTPARG